MDDIEQDPKGVAPGHPGMTPAPEPQGIGDRFLFDASPFGIFVIDHTGSVVDCNPIFLSITALPREKLIGFNPLGSPQGRTTLGAHLRRALAGEPVDFETRHAFIPGGKIHQCRYVLQPIKSGGSEFSVLGLVEEIGRRKKQEQAVLKATKTLKRQLASETARFRGLVDQSLAGIYMIRDGQLVYANQMLAQLYGVPSAAAFIGTSVFDLVAPESRATMQEYMTRRLTGDISDARYEFIGLRPDGGLLELEAHGRVVEIDGQPTIVGVIIDISARKALERELNYQALHDDLTCLPNRKLFFDRMNQLIRRARREASRFAVLFLDLDGFKTINDCHGHGSGDQVLCQVARQLSACLRESDTVARLGGDEFAILLPAINGPPDVERVTDAIQARIALATKELGIPEPISASIGISLYPDQGEDADRLLALADQAMYRAKSQGHGLVCFAGAGEK